MLGGGRNGQMTIVEFINSGKASCCTSRRIPSKVLKNINRIIIFSFIVALLREYY